MTITKFGTKIDLKVLCINDDRTAFRVPGVKYDDSKPWEIKEGETYEVVEMYTKVRRDADDKIYDRICVYLLKRPARSGTFTDRNTGEVVEVGFNSKRFKILPKE